MSQLMRLWYLSHRRPAKAKASLRIRAVSVQSRQSLRCLHTWSMEVDKVPDLKGERGGSVVECRTPEREVRGSRPTAAVLCPWARHFTPRKYWLITQEAMAPSRHDWKIVDWDVKPQHNQPKARPKIRHLATLDGCTSAFEDWIYGGRKVP